MTNKIQELMKREDRGAQLANSVLTKSFRRLLQQLNITPEMLSTLMNVYLRSPSFQLEGKHPPEKIANQIANNKGNLKKEIEKDEYTFKVYLKLLRLLRAKEFRISMEATWHDGYTVRTTYTDSDFLNGDNTKMNISNEEIESFYRTLSEAKPSAAEEMERAELEKGLAENSEKVDWYE